MMPCENNTKKYIVSIFKSCFLLRNKKLSTFIKDKNGEVYHSKTINFFKYSTN